MQNRAINNIIIESNHLFKQCVLAYTALNLGQSTLDGFSDSVCIATTIGLNIQTEPIPMSELKHYRKGLGHFLLEVFHGKLVQVWHESLSELYSILVDLHFSGNRQFKELKVHNISLDFRNAIALDEQIKERLCKDFYFQKYGNKIKLLNRIFNPHSDHSDHLQNVAKHVQIRNAFQHHAGSVDDFMLKELGLQKIYVLNNNGNKVELKEGDKIELSVPEFDNFRKSLLLIGQVWRKWNVKDSNGVNSGTS
ncbi:MAG: hypothetical protein AB9866_25830 [Syntrophobacteraceae bacterium]